MQILFFLFGAVLGSAGNAIIDRVPRNVSWLKGRSRCDHCKHTLAWFDLIPLVSYALLQGRCRHCRARIPLRNFWVELAMGLGFALLYPSWLLMAMFWVTLVIAVMDWETQLVSELLVIIWGGLVLVSIFSSLGLTHLLGLGSAVGLIGGLWVATRGRGMGFGDVEIAAVLGVWLGWPKIAVGLEVAFIVGAMVGLWQVLRHKNKMRGKIAFGTFLILGGWIAYLWGDTILKILYG